MSSVKKRVDCYLTVWWDGQQKLITGNNSGTWFQVNTLPELNKRRPSAQITPGTEIGTFRTRVQDLARYVFWYSDLKHLIQDFVTPSYGKLGVQCAAIIHEWISVNLFNGMNLSCCHLLKHCIRLNSLSAL